jgi:hypothetical protein
MIATESDVFSQISDKSGELILLPGKVVGLKDIRLAGGSLSPFRHRLRLRRFPGGFS